MSTYSSKKILSCVIALLMVFCAIPLTAQNAEASIGDSGGSHLRSGSGLNTPVGLSGVERTPITVTKNSELVTAIQNAGNNDVIYITKNIKVSSQIQVDGVKNILFAADPLAEEPILLTTGTNRHFLIEDGAEIVFSFEDVILDGVNSGGGFQVESGAELTLQGAIIQNCRRNAGLSTISGGGGINNLGTVVAENTIIQDCTVIHMGGGVFNSGVFTLEEGSAIRNNTATPYSITRMGKGGGVYNLGGTFIMNGGEISGNTAEWGAGFAVYNNHSFYRYSYLEINGGEIYNNNASVYGGGIALCYSNDFKMTGGEIYGNTATDAGGGIFGYQNDNHIFEIENAKIYDNSAKDGGGIYAVVSPITIADSEIYGNIAENNGGGIVCPASANLVTTIKNSNIYNNTAESGGGIYIEPEAYSFLSVDENVTFSGNTASKIHLLSKNENHYSTYIQRIFATQFSEQLPYGYNNYDINYAGGTVVEVEHTVTFDSNGGTAVESQKVKDNEFATEPKDVVNPGHTLEGWYREDTGDRWEFTDPVTEDMTLVARWEINTLTVTFDADGGSPEPEDQKVSYGGKVAEPSQPSRGDDIFLGWYTEGGAEWDFQQHTVTENLKLVAHWKTPDVPDPIKYTVTFDTDGGAPIPADQTVLEGGKAVKPAQPSKEGYVFDGWYNGTSEWNFGKDTVNTDITLTARWTEKPTTPPVTPEKTEYTVRFDTDGGTPVPQSQKVEKGEKAARPAENPSKSGYSFTGWYYEGRLWNFDEDTVEGNIVLTARWKANESSGGDKDNGTDKPDELDDNKGGETPGGGSSGGGSRDRDSSVSVGRDVYINDQDIPLANELLTIFEEDVPLAEINLFDIPDTGVRGNVAGLLAVGAFMLAALAYKRED